MSTSSNRKNLCTSFTISGDLTLAHYLFVVAPLLQIQKKYNLFVSVADLHAITTYHQPTTLLQLRKKTAAYLLACGVKTDNLFVQSQIHGHCKLCFILSCHVNLGTLQRMTQFKSKKRSNLENLALLSYPLLMASDILLYDADVLVSNDQKQHVELIRDLAIKLNHKWQKNIFHPPEIVKTAFFAYRLRDLQEPEKKMSKSNQRSGGTIFLSDNKEQIFKKLLRAKTDSENQIVFDFDNKPGVSNLILIYSLIKKISLVDAENILKNKCDNYQDLKTLLAEAVFNLLQPIQERAYQLEQNFQLLDQALEQGRKKAQTVVNDKFRKIEKLLGFEFSF